MTMPAPNQRRDRLSIDIEPGLRRRLEVAATSRGLSVREYVEGILTQAIASEMPEEKSRDSSSLPEQTSIPRLTEEEQQQGLRVLAELENLSDLLASKHGPLARESWELLNASRDARTRGLSRSDEG